MEKQFFTFMFGLFLIPGLCFGGPFGAEMGDKPEKYIALGAEKFLEIEGVYTTTEMPKKHSLLLTYQLCFGDTGLYEVSGTTLSRSKNDVKTFLSQLENKYGHGQLIDGKMIWRNITTDNIYQITLDYYRVVTDDFITITYTFNNKKIADDKRALIDTDAL